MIENEKKPLVSICIPTFNGKKYLEEILKKIYSQKVKFSYEVLIIDSGSNDETLDIISKYPVRLYQIPNKEFGHGKTRNLMAKYAHGNYIVFLVQDATPANSKWLQELISPFSISDDIVAVYSRHIPRPDAPPFIKKDTEYFFKSLINRNRILVQRLQPKKTYSDYEWGRLIFFSDVNCALRKSFIEKIPYENVNYAEDQLMGEKIIKRGYAKAYNPKAEVYHSHHYPIFQYLFRYYDEYRGLKETLGYIDNLNLKNIWLETIKGWGSDIRYIIKLNKSIFYKIKWIILALLFNFERRLAALMIKYEEKIPIFLKEFFSMEARIKKKFANKKKSHKSVSIFDLLINKWLKLKFVFQSYGWRGVIKLIKGFFLKRFFFKFDIKTIDDFSEFLYKYITEVNISSPPQTETNLKIEKFDTKFVLNWIIPDFGIGSGGHMTIFRIINFLETRGFQNNIYMFGPLRYKNVAIIKNTIDKYFIKLKANVYIRTEYMADSDAVIATSWHTAYAAFNITNTRKKIYLVQDFEPYFYPISSEYIFAENTYRMGFFHLCASKWLAEKLKKKYKVKADYFNLGYDEKYYHPPPLNKKRDDKTIVFYGRWVTSRRGFELGALALWEVYKQIPDVKIKIFGWDQIRKDIPFPYINLGVLSPKKLGELYREATVGLSISLTNISLVPIEMMACSLPVVDIDHPSISTMFVNKKDLLLSDSDPKLIAKNILLLINNPKEKEVIAKNAFNKVKTNFTWQKNFEKIELILKDQLK